MEAHGKRQGWRPLRWAAMLAVIGLSGLAFPSGPACAAGSGTVMAWGSNASGQLGASAVPAAGSSSSTGVEVSGLSDVASVAGGNAHSLALRSDGTVWAWGLNSTGQLGSDAVAVGAGSAVPVQVSGLTGAVAVAAGNAHSLALLSDGTVRAWGLNISGQLGNGATGTSAIPVVVLDSPGGAPFSGAIAIAAGLTYSLALKADGTVWAWGSNGSGQLGNPSVPVGLGSSSPVPVQVAGLDGVIAIAAGGNHALALKSDGTVWAWGADQWGQLGDANTALEPAPVPVSGLTGVTAITASHSPAGIDHSLALRADGTVWAWGSNREGQLGSAAVPVGSSSPIPVQVDGLSGITAIGSGTMFSLALKSDHTAWAWGWNLYHQLGNPSVATSTTTATTSGGTTGGGGKGGKGGGGGGGGTTTTTVDGFSTTPVPVSGVEGAGVIDGGGTHGLAVIDPATGSGGILPPVPSDESPPATTAAVVPDPNEAGWYRSDVTVTLTATDTGGSGVSSIAYSATGAQPFAGATVPGASATVQITAEGDTTLSYFATDNAGNIEAAHSLTVRIDRTAPHLTIAAGTGPARPGDTILVTVQSDEPLVSAPTVDMSGACIAGGDLVVSPTDTPQAYSGGYVVPAMAVGCSLTLSAIGVDRADNPSAPATASVALIGETAPLAQDQSVSAGEGPVSITLGATDNEGDPLSYTVLEGPTHGTLSGTPPHLTYTASAGFSGDDRFTFKAGDGRLDSNVATVAIAVTAPPVAVPGDLTGDGVVNIQDATIALRVAVGLLSATEAQERAGDVNGDGVINIQDATVILRRAIGL